MIAYAPTEPPLMIGTGRLEDPTVRGIVLNTRDVDELRALLRRNRP